MMYRIAFMAVFCCLFEMTTFAQDDLSSDAVATITIDYEATSTRLEPFTQEMLLDFLTKIRVDSRITRVELVVHAGTRDLSEERTSPVLNFLTEQGIEASLVDATTVISDKNNIQLLIALSEQPIELPKVEEKKLVEVEEVPAVKRYCAGASKKAQVFNFEPSKNVSLKGNEGTELNINRADLVHQDGTPVEQAIQVELKEFFKPADILLADLHTMDGDKVLETAGMLHLEITSEGKPLALKKGRSAKIKMPTNQAKAKEGMNLYFGETRTDGAVNWNRVVRTTASNTTVNKASEPMSAANNSYVQLKLKTVLDSVKEEAYRDIQLKDTHSSGFPAFRTRPKHYTHTEEYFDLELPYIPTPPENTRKVNKGGIWINLDRDFSIEIKLPSVDPPPPPSVDILVEVSNMKISELDKANRGGQAPRVALMLKDRSVFLRGRFLETDLETGEMKLTFERVPLDQEAVLVAFLDNGEEVLYASQPLSTQKTMAMQQLDMKAVDRETFKNSMAGLAN